MAKLTLDAIQGIPVPVYASHDRGMLVLSVTDQMGKPVKGLSAKHFKLSVLSNPHFVTGEGLSQNIAIAIHDVSSSLHPLDYYYVTIKPAPGNAWAGGLYVLGLSVKRSSIGGHKPVTNNGQTLVGFTVASRQRVMMADSRWVRLGC